MHTIQIERLTKRYGGVAVVRDLSFTAPAGQVTGFFGANGAGKSTTLRMLLGLSRATSGRALIDGRPFHELLDPGRTVGAVLESSPFHPGRTARQALLVLTDAGGLDYRRVTPALAMVGLDDVAGVRVGRFSLGMRQRLALAAAMLGDPAVLVLDEPTNGLDPQGLQWLRGWLLRQAGEGRTVLVSSHLLSEMSSCADRAVVIADGALTYEGPIGELEGRESGIEATLLALLGTQRDGLDPWNTHDRKELTTCAR
jgi:ABC-2 type transport system ATP-binding protein